MKQSLQIKQQPNWGQIIIFTSYRKRLFESIPKTVWHLDEPVADPSAIALYHLNQLAKEHVTVVLSGKVLTNYSEDTESIESQML